MNQDLGKYYDQRAAEYDKVYAIPEEQEDLKRSSAIFQDLLQNKKVLEIACGTGYWTSEISKTAQSILATDINQSVMDLAQQRNYYCPVKFQVADALQLNCKEKYNAFFGGFIWSHLLLQDLDELLRNWNKLLLPQSKVIFIDSKAVARTIHDSKRIAERDAWGNTYQLRQLADGSQHKVLKNFPKRDFLENKLSSIGSNFKWIDLDHYWIAHCETN